MESIINPADEIQSPEMTFRNHVIMRHLAHCLNIKDLLILRAVTHVSAKTTRLHMRNTGIPFVNIKNDDQMNRFVAEANDGPRPIPFSSAKLFLNEVSMDGIEQFLKFKDDFFGLFLVTGPGLNDWEDEETLLDEHKVKLTRILSGTGENLKRLRLDPFCNFPLEEHHLPETFPFLQKLEMELFLPFPERYLAMQISVRSPRLQELKITGDPFVPFELSLISFLPGLLHSLTHRPTPPFLTLECDVRPDDSTTFEQLTTLGFSRIRSLGLGFTLDDLVDPEELPWGPLVQNLLRLLQLQTVSLEELLLDEYHGRRFPVNETPIQIHHLPRFEKLKSLSLSLPELMGTTLAPFIPEQFPVLTHVHIGSNSGWLYGGVFPTVKSLHINYQSNLMNFNNTFPHLKKLVFYVHRTASIVGSVVNLGGAEVEELGIFPIIGNTARYLESYMRYFKNRINGKRVLGEHFLGKFLGHKLEPQSRLQSRGKLPPVLLKYPKLVSFHVGILSLDEWDTLIAKSRCKIVPTMNCFRVYLFGQPFTSPNISDLRKFHHKVDLITVQIPSNHISN